LSAQLGRNRYGKDGIRLVLVRRGEGPDGADVLRDLTVDVRLEGDFARVHHDGDNSLVLPTDTMRSTVYALAQPYLSGSLEAFGTALAKRFLDVSAASSLAEVRLREHSWVRVAGDAHAFTGGTAESATAVVTGRRGAATDVRSGVTGLTLLKTTGSAFSGFLRDELTVLAETDDRILATEATAQWTYLPGHTPAYDDVRAAAREAMVATFAAHDSQSVQHTLHAMGEAVLASCADIEAMTLRLPNKHHVLVDLAPFGLPNDRAVYVATDRPFGVIEGEVRRSEAVEA
jgi:urate oxidase